MRHPTSNNTLLCLHLLIFFLFICHGTNALAQQYFLSGNTMGTTYSVKFITDMDIDLNAWQKKVDIKLKSVNQKLSMYDPNSELSFFNRHPEKKPIKISKDLFTILNSGKDLYQRTGGAWDGTVKPLVDLWGFGSKKQKKHIPDAKTIQATLKNVGFRHITIQPPDTIVKQRALTLDLGSIAKGYGVDQIAAMFKLAGIGNILVEIGGELYASGHNRKSDAWQVGISRPSKLPSGQGIYAVLFLENQAIASSGDYRNYFRKNGKTYSHLIDPSTGYPVDNSVAAASVVADNCATADGLATALMVMDVPSALALINRLDNTECLIITRDGDSFRNHFSKNFKNLMK